MSISCIILDAHTSFNGNKPKDTERMESSRKWLAWETCVRSFLHTAWLWAFASLDLFLPFSSRVLWEDAGRCHHLKTESNLRVHLGPALHLNNSMGNITMILYHNRYTACLVLYTYCIIETSYNMGPRWIPMRPLYTLWGVILFVFGYNTM